MTDEVKVIIKADTSLIKRELQTLKQDLQNLGNFVNSLSNNFNSLNGSLGNISNNVRNLGNSVNSSLSSSRSVVNNFNIIINNTNNSVNNLSTNINRGTVNFNNYSSSIRTTTSSLSGLTAASATAASATTATTAASTTAASSSFLSLTRNIKLASIAFLSFQGIKAAINTNDDYEKMTAKLKQATNSQESYNQALKDVKEIAKNSQSEIEGVATFYSKLNASLSQLGVSQKDVASMTETISLGLKTSGATATETSSILLQLSQALSKGTLNGDELNSMLENSSVLSQILADSLNVSTGELKKMGSEGLITLESLRKAFTDQTVLNSLRQQSKEINTVSGAFVELKNTLSTSVGEFLKYSGIFDGLTNSIKGLSSGIEKASNGFKNFQISRLTSEFDSLQKKYEYINKLPPLLQNIYGGKNKLGDIADEMTEVQMKLNKLNNVVNNKKEIVIKPPKIDNKQKFDEEKKSFDLMKNQAENEKKIKVESYEYDLKKLKENLNKKIISLKQYQEQANSINENIANANDNYYSKILGGLKKLSSINYEPENAKIKMEIDDAETNKKLNSMKTEEKKLEISSVKVSGGSSKTDYTQQIYDAKRQQITEESEAKIQLIKLELQEQLKSNDYLFNNNKKSLEQYYEEKKKLTKQDVDLEIKEKQRLLNIALQDQKENKFKTPVERIKNETDIIKLKSEINILERQSINNINEINRELQETISKYKNISLMSEIKNNQSDKNLNLDLENIEMSKKLALKNISNMQMLNFERNLADEQLKIKTEALEKEKEKDNISKEDLLRIEDEKLQIIREHKLKIAEISKQITLEQQKDAIAIKDGIQNSFATLIDGLQSKKKSFKELLKDMINSFVSMMNQMASKNIAKFLFEPDQNGSQGILQGAANSFANMFTNKGPSNSGTTDVIQNTLNGLTSNLNNIFSSLGNNLSSIFSKISIGGGGGSSGGGLLSSMGSLFGNLLSFDVGTDYVPNDMIAKIHKGERIVPAKYNNDKYAGGNSMKVSNTFIMNQTPDMRTQMQIGAFAGSHLQRAMKRNG